MARPGSSPVAARRRRLLLGWVRTVVGLLILLGVVYRLILPELAGAGDSLGRLAGTRPWWIVLAVVLEVLSLLTYSLFSRSLLRDSRIPFGRLLRCDLTGFGVSHVIPGGGAAASALRFRLLVTSGASPADATAAIAVEGVGTVAALTAVVWLTVVPVVLSYGPSPLYVAVLLAGGLLSAAVAGRRRLLRIAEHAFHLVMRRLPKRVHPAVSAVGLQLRTLLSSPQVLRSVVVWGSLNWLFDAAVLWVLLAAYGTALNPAALVLAYGFACLVAFLPISPGGLGVVEGLLLPTLIGFGVPGEVAVLGVLSWRVLQFWLPIPVAGLCYLSLRTPGWRDKVAESRFADRV